MNTVTKEGLLESAPLIGSYQVQRIVGHETPMKVSNEDRRHDAAWLNSWRRPWRFRLSRYGLQVVTPIGSLWIGFRDYDPALDERWSGVRIYRRVFIRLIGNTLTTERMRLVFEYLGRSR